MSILEELNNILNQYEDNLFEIFQREIKLAREFCITNSYDSIETFIYVNLKINDIFNKLAVVWGYLPNDNYQVTENLLDKIYSSINDLSINATNQIKEILEKVTNSPTSDKLIEEYEKVRKLFKRLDENNISFIYEGIELKKKI